MTKTVVVILTLTAKEPMGSTRCLNPSHQMRSFGRLGWFYSRDGRVQGILEVSRSIGDGRFKHCGVSCVPDIKKCQLTDNDRYLLLACDGLWKGFSSETALEFLQNIMEVHSDGV